MTSTALSLPACSRPPTSRPASPVRLAVLASILILIGSPRLTSAGIFGPNSDYPAGVNAYAIAVADVNRDGRPDVVVANHSNSISVLLGNGNGTFAGTTNFSNPGAPYSIAIGDVNSDGKSDVVTSNSVLSGINVQLGDGAGGFGSATGFITGGAPGTLDLQDLNCDGILDVAVPNYSSGTVSILLGNGLGSFGPPTDLVLGGNPQAVATGDLNCDGTLDMVVANLGIDAISVLWGNGSGGFGSRTDYANGMDPYFVAMGDLNCDGKLDVISCDAGSNTVSVRLGDGVGGLGGRYAFSTGSNPYAVVISDLNLDGKQDLTVANAGETSNGITVLMGDGTGSFAPAQGYLTGNSPWSLAVADLNNDGRPDVVTPNRTAGTASVLLNLTPLGSGPPQFNRTAYFANGLPYTVLIGDMNCDGRPDIVTSNSTSNDAKIFLGLGNGVFGAPSSTATGSAPGTAALSDVNCDGKLDMAVPNYSSGTVSILRGNGAGGFAPKTDLPLGGNPQAVAFSDLNRDGRPDLVVANHATNMISVLPGDGLGGFGPATHYTMGTDPFFVAAADVNRDGKPDILSCDQASNSISVRLGDGSGALGTRTSFGTGANPYSVEIVDLNRDGQLDLVAANAGGSTVSVLLGDGIGGFAAQTAYGAGVSPGSVAVADLNRDGRLDLVSANRVSNTISVLLGNGAGSFEPKIDFTIGGGQPYSVAAADLNCDGTSDLVTGNHSSFDISVFLNTTALQGCAPAPQDLVSWWKLDGDASDATQSHSGGVVGGGGTFGSGEVGQGFRPDPSTIIEVPDHSRLNPTNLTLDAWVKLDSLSVGNPVIVWKGNGAGIAYTSPFELGVYGSTQLPSLRGKAVAVIGNPTDFQELDGTIPVPIGSWVHLAMTADGTTFRLYQNGQLLASAPQTVTPGASSYPLQIGGTIAHTAPNSFTGTIDEVELHSSAATAQQIAAIHAAGSIGKCPAVSGTGDRPETLVLALTAGPNPSHGRFTVDFTIASPDHVRLEIFDVAGRLIASLFDGRKTPGRHTLVWDGTDRAGSPAPDGVYFARLSARGTTQAVRLVIVK